MNSFVNNFSSAMANDQKFPSSDVWCSAAGRLNFDSPLLFRDQSDLDVTNIAAGDSNLISRPKSSWPLPRPDIRGNTSPTGDLLSIDELCRQMPSLSLMTSQDASFEGGVGTGQDPNGHRPGLKTSLPTWAVDIDGRVSLSLGEILHKGYLQPFAKDRLGCEHLQAMYPRVNTEDRLAIIKQVLEDPVTFMDLSCDVFGNFFVQLIIDWASASEQFCVAKRLKNHMFQLCLNRYSCRVVQKALDVFPQNLKLNLICELQHASLVRLCIDQNGNHVIQKIMNGFPVKVWSFLIDTLLRDEKNFFETAENKYGCRIIQLAVEQLAGVSMRTHQSDILLKRMMDVITRNCMRLTLNEFSNYIIQFIIGCQTLAHYRDVIIENCLLCHLLSLSQEKYASHVVEKAMQHAPPALLHEMMDEIFDGYVPHPETHRDALDIMMFHQYGNYIIQRMLSICVDATRVWKVGGAMEDLSQRLAWLRRLSERISTNEIKLAQYSSGKKIMDILAEVPPMFLSPDANLSRTRAFDYRRPSPTFSH